MKKATAIEILVFISLLIHKGKCLLIHKGLYKLNTFRITRLFSERYGLPIFSAIMFWKRFSFHSCKSFVWERRNPYTDQWKQDRSAAARELLEMAKGMWLPVHWWNLYPTCNQVLFKQLSPCKPAKYGLLFKSVSAAIYPYTFIIPPYARKPQNEGGQFYHPGAENVAKYLIDRMDSKQKLEGRNISFDWLYTSFKLATSPLIEKHLACIGTLMANRIDIPPDVNKIQQREIQSTKFKFYWDKEHDLVLGSYVVSLSTKKKKNVPLLSTRKPIFGTTMDDKIKVTLCKFYDFTKGGLDKVEQRMSFYTCKFKPHKWSLSLTSLIWPVWIPQLHLPSMKKGIFWNKTHLNLVQMLYAVLLIRLFNKEINHIWLPPSSRKLLWYLIRCSFRVPPLHHQRELMLEIFQQRVKRGQDATCLLNSYQQIIIRNPYLEPNHFAKLGVNTRTQNI